MPLDINVKITILVYGTNVKEASLPQNFFDVPPEMLRESTHATKNISKIT